MKFKHLFYDNTVDFRKISKRRLVLSIVLGLLSAFAIYCMFYVFRESFRVMNYGIENAPNIISESNRNFYNLFFAFLSLIFGNSVGICFLVSRPSSFLSRRNPKRRRIINDQVFLNLNFVYWLGKIGIIFSFVSNFIDFQYLSYFSIPLVLLLIVMYLETWKTLIQVLGKKKYKIVFIHFLSFLILSFGLSRLDIIDYKKLDDISLESNPIMNLPKSFYSDTEINHHRNSIVRFKLLKDENDSLVIIMEGWKPMKLKGVVYLIYRERAALREEDINRIIVSVSANKNMELKYIKQFEAELFSINQIKVRYQVFNSNFETSRFESKGFNKLIDKSVLAYREIDFPPLPPPALGLDYYETIAFKDTIHVQVNDLIKFKDIIVKEEDLVKLFEDNFTSETLFEYRFESNITYQKYIKVLSAHHQAIHNLRLINAPNGLDISKSIYGLSEEDNSKVKELYEKVPMYYIEIN